MREADLQAHLLAHPTLLFPDARVDRLRAEVPIDGRRVDLVAEVTGDTWLIELKAVPITREHVGQLVEYYGLMRLHAPDARYRMMLVAPVIPAWRAAYLEELGIVCVEVPSLPDGAIDTSRARRSANKARTRSRELDDLDREAHANDALTPGDFGRSPTHRTVSLVRHLVHDLLPSVTDEFPDLEVVPLRVSKAASNDVEAFRDPANGALTFDRGGPWFGFKVGVGRAGPKNDIPNLSVVSYPHGLDVTINAELLPSQTHFLRRVTSSPSRFDALAAQVPGLHLQTWLELEHQPRAYHWVPLDDLKGDQLRAAEVPAHLHALAPLLRLLLAP